MPINNTAASLLHTLQNQINQAIAITHRLYLLNNSPEIEKSLAFLQHNTDIDQVTTINDEFIVRIINLGYPFLQKGGVLALPKAIVASAKELCKILVSDTGNTALHILAIKNLKSLIFRLIADGIDIKIKNKQNKTAFDIFTPSFFSTVKDNLLNDKYKEYISLRMQIIAGINIDENKDLLKALIIDIDTNIAKVNLFSVYELLHPTVLFNTNELCKIQPGAELQIYEEELNYNNNINSAMADNKLPEERINELNKMIEAFPGKGEAYYRLAMYCYQLFEEKQDKELAEIFISNANKAVTQKLLIIELCELHYHMAVVCHLQKNLTKALEYAHKINALRQSFSIMSPAVLALECKNILLICTIFIDAYKQKEVLDSQAMKSSKANKPDDDYLTFAESHVQNVTELVVKLDAATRLTIYKRTAEVLLCIYEINHSAKLLKQISTQLTHAIEKIDSATDNIKYEQMACYYLYIKTCVYQKKLTKAGELFSKAKLKFTAFQQMYGRSCNSMIQKLQAPKTKQAQSQSNNKNSNKFKKLIVKQSLLYSEGKLDEAIEVADKTLSLSKDNDIYSHAITLANKAYLYRLKANKNINNLSVYEKYQNLYNRHLQEAINYIENNKSQFPVESKHHRQLNNLYHFIKLDNYTVNTGASVSISEESAQPESPQVIDEIKLDNSFAVHDATIPLSIIEEQIIQFLEKNGYIAIITGGRVRDFYINRMPRDTDIVIFYIGNDRIINHLTNIYNLLAHSEITIQTAAIISKLHPILRLTFANHINIEIIDASLKLNYAELLNAKSAAYNNQLLKNLFTTLFYHAKLGDCTANVIYYYAKLKKIIDPLNGLQAINDKTLKTVKVSYEAFNEDHSRCMRFLRYSGMFAWQIDEEALSAIKFVIKQQGLALNPGRYYHEINNLFFLGSGLEIYKLLKANNLLTNIFPTLHDLTISKFIYLHEVMLIEILQRLDHLISQNAGNLITTNYSVFYAVLLYAPLCNKLLVHYDKSALAHNSDYISHVIHQELNIFSSTIKLPPAVRIQTETLLTDAVYLSIHENGLIAFAPGYNIRYLEFEEFIQIINDAETLYRQSRYSEPTALAHASYWSNANDSVKPKLKTLMQKYSYGIICKQNTVVINILDCDVSTNPQEIINSLLELTQYYLQNKIGFKTVIHGGNKLIIMANTETAAQNIADKLRRDFLSGDHSAQDLPSIMSNNNNNDPHYR